MSIDMISDPQGRDESMATLAPLPRSKSGKLVTFAVLVAGVLAIGTLAAVLSRDLFSNTSANTSLTHTVRYGDLVVSVVEQGTLESSDNTEIKCRVRGFSTVTWVVDSGTVVEAGDELVRLDTKVIEETVSLTKTNVHTARATLARSKANVAKSEIAIQAYLEGRYQLQKETLEKTLLIAESNLKSARKMHRQSEGLFKQGFVTDLEVQGNALAVTEAELELKVARTQLEVLETYTKEMQLETLNGNLIASKSKLEADEAGLRMDEARRDRALEELDACVMRAERSGLVIYPSAAAWKDTPDIDEGATVRKDQVLLLMPDLEQMQVKVGIHESMIDRMAPGLQAIVTLPDRTLHAKVSSVANVTRPAGWWTGNVVKYDTIVQLPSDQGLKPGMSAEVEIILAEHRDVLTIPVAAFVETSSGHACWVKSSDGVSKRMLKLGDSNDVFAIVEAGLKEGDEVILNPLAIVDEAQDAAVRMLDQLEQEGLQQDDLQQDDLAQDDKEAQDDSGGDSSNSKPDQDARPATAGAESESTVEPQQGASDGGS